MWDVRNVDNWNKFDGSKAYTAYIWFWLLGFGLLWMKNAAQMMTVSELSLESWLTGEPCHDERFFFIYKKYNLSERTLVCPCAN